MQALPPAEWIDCASRVRPGKTASSYKAIRENILDTMPLFMRIDAHDDYVENGLAIDDIIAFCKMAGEAGRKMIHVNFFVNLYRICYNEPNSHREVLS